MNRQKLKIDIVNEILEACIIAYPVSSFIISLYQQYQQRGSLSKKQLQGLYNKSLKIEDLSPGKLATLEALIKKMNTKYKSELPTKSSPLFEKNEEIGNLITIILQKYPQHKAVLLFKEKYQNNIPLSTTEISNLKKISQLVK